MFVELPAEACTDKSKVALLLRSMYGCRDAGVNWKFAICQVMIAKGFVQGRASPCTYRHLEKQLRVWVHGDDFVPLGHIINVKCCFFFCETARVLGLLRVSLGPLDTTTVCKAFVCWGRIVEWTDEALGRQILDMLPSSGNRSA